MLDMHVHLLYGVDDGPKHVETSIQMLKMASEQGITEIIITPHAFHPSYDVRPNTIKRLVPELSAITKQLNINIQLHTGQEIRLHENLIEHIHSGEALTLANSRYLLLEMPSYTVPLFSFQMIESIVHDGFIPIIAHPERNIAIISDPHILQRLIKLGAYAQVNADSLLGIYGRRVQKIAFQLIKANLIHCYGSDTHNITTRKNHFWKGLRVLEKKKLSTIVEVLLNNNHCILADEPFSLLESVNLQTKKWWSLYGNHWMESRNG